MKRELNRKFISDLLINVENDLSETDLDKKTPFFVLSNKSENIGYCAPWSAVSVSDAVFKVAKCLVYVEDDSQIIKDINNLQLVLWFLGDTITGDIDSLNYIICDLNRLILEVDDV